MNRYLLSLLKWTPRIFLFTGLTCIYYYQIPILKRNIIPVNCFSILPNQNKALNNLLSNIIKIAENDSVIGYAYCFRENYVVSMSRDLRQLIKKKKTKAQKILHFYQGQQQIQGKLEIVGQFQNLTFLKVVEGNVKPLNSSEIDIITRVEIIRKKQHLSVQHGYYVANEAGFGIIDGHGQIGSCVTYKGTIAGLITYAGQDNQQDFLRMILWKNLNNILLRLQKPPLKLGITVTSKQQIDEGVIIEEIQNSSVFKKYIQQGDYIMKINGNAIKNPEDLRKSIMMSPETVKFTVKDKNNKVYDIDIRM